MAMYDQTEAPAERNRATVNPYDPAKSLLLGWLIALLTPRDALGWLPSAVFSCLAALLIVSKKADPVGRMLRLNPVSLYTLAFPVALGVLLTSLELAVWEGIDYATGRALGRWAELFPAPIASTPSARDILSACLVAPVAEEMFYRGFFSYALMPLGAGWAIVLPSVFFGLSHHPIGMAGAFAGGLIAATLTMRHKSVVPAIILHMAENTYLCLLAVLGSRYSGRENLGDVLYYGLIVSGILLGLKIRPELKLLWNDVKGAFKDFGARPRFGQNMRFLFKHWSYILLVLVLAFSIALIVLVSISGEPL